MKKPPLYFVLLLSCAFFTPYVSAWEHHPVFTRGAITFMPEIAEAEQVAATTLEDFLMAVEPALETALDAQEAWSRAHLGWYAPRPEPLRFAATGNRDDIRDRFFRAIRINPNTRTPLYYSRLTEVPGAASQGLPLREVALLPDTAGIDRFDYWPLHAGDLVAPVDVVASASNEPDFGMDVGLFENNNTPFGAEYGFGEQAFGDPTLDYGSQAPFHMGFYHESRLVFLFGSFLKESYVEYRIHLFKTLSELAFAEGQDYWGWRFMGWGMHYVADLSMPYHTTVLPGYSTLRMLVVNLLDILGMPRLKDNAVQLVSNRHMAIERYQRLVFEDVWRRQDWQDPTMAALKTPESVPAYTNDAPRKQLARSSNALSRKLNRVIKTYMPAAFVNDPGVELVNRDDLDQIVEMIEDAHGAEALDELNALTAEALALFGAYGRAYALAILGAS